jgi:carbamoyltransferase
MDGVGEWATASIGVGRGSAIERTKEIHWPDALGLLFWAFRARSRGSGSGAQASA